MAACWCAVAGIAAPVIAPAAILSGGECAMPIDVVILGPALRADPDPALNVRRLVDAGHRVVVIDGSAALATVAAILAAGARGYVTRDHNLSALAGTIRAIASGGTAWSMEPAKIAEPANSPQRPHLSEREHAVLMTYAAGLTLSSTARRLGITSETAKTYLKRAKAKYHRAGLPVYTKIDLVEWIRADCTEGTFIRLLASADTE